MTSGEVAMSRSFALPHLPVELHKPAEVITHLESLEDHEPVHTTEHHTGKPERGDLRLQILDFRMETAVGFNLKSAI